MTKLTSLIRWTGMIAELRSQKADMAVIDMSVTSIRQTAVDFTMPFMSTGVRIYKYEMPVEERQRQTKIRWQTQKLWQRQRQRTKIDMSVTSIRQTAVDFTMPFMSTGVRTNQYEMPVEERQRQRQRQWQRQKLWQRRRTKIDMSVTSIRQTAVDFTMPFMSTGVRTNKYEMPVTIKKVPFDSHVQAGNPVQEEDATSPKSILFPATAFHWGGHPCCHRQPSTSPTSSST